MQGFSTKAKQNHAAPAPKLISIARHLKSFLWFNTVFEKTKQKFGHDSPCLFMQSELGINFVSPAFILPSAALAWLGDLSNYLISNSGTGLFLFIYQLDSPSLISQHLLRNDNIQPCKCGVSECLNESPDSDSLPGSFADIWIQRDLIRFQTFSVLSLKSTQMPDILWFTHH